jgi:23S rRNA pseudouridine1911/1915/1917 synthase
MPPILYEDEYLLVVDKPAGLVVHPDGRNDFETLADMLIKERPELTDIGEPMTLEGKVIKRPGIVHRIDKETSGCLLIAKTQESFLFFKKQFQDHTIQKTYHACLYGVPKEREGIITEPIGRARADVRMWAVGRGARGDLREATTRYKILADIGGIEGKGSTEADVFSYVEAKPETGRTHQLRVHFKSLNHPIIADPLYASGRTGGLGFTRLALHAREIEFQLPNGKRLTVTSPYPSDFQSARALFGLEK